MCRQVVADAGEGAGAPKGALAWLHGCALAEVNQEPCPGLLQLPCMHVICERAVRHAAGALLYARCVLAEEDQSRLLGAASAQEREDCQR